MVPTGACSARQSNLYGLPSLPDGHNFSHALEDALSQPGAGLPCLPQPRPKSRSSPGMGTAFGPGNRAEPSGPASAGMGQEPSGRPTSAPGLALDGESPALRLRRRTNRTLFQSGLSVSSQEIPSQFLGKENKILVPLLAEQRARPSRPANGVMSQQVRPIALGDSRA